MDRWKVQQNVLVLTDEDNHEPVYSPTTNPFSHVFTRRLFIVMKWVAVGTLLLQLTFTALLYLGFVELKFDLTSKISGQAHHRCHPTLPSILKWHPPSPQNHAFHYAQKSLDAYLSRRTSHSDIDSLVLAVVTADGVVFQKGYGALRANETDENKRGHVNANTLYRLASVSKMFAVMETMILRDKGILNLDDSVEKFLPNFTYHGGGWDHYAHAGPHYHSAAKQHHSSITLRQLASHMSGIGRDFPPGDLKSWPRLDDAQIEYTVPSRDAIMKSITSLPLVTPPYTFPSYSNTGFNLLGYTIVAADKSGQTYSDLLHRDIFRPLGLSSTFNLTADNIHQVAVASVNSAEVDLDFTDADNAAGGQYSTLTDLTKVMQMLIAPSSAKGLLPAQTISEWLRPIHGFDDGLTEIGIPWEIVKLPDSHGIPRRFYSKAGNLFGFHSFFTFNPSSSFGVVALITGSYANAAQLSLEAAHRFQPVFDGLLSEAAYKSFGGRWRSGDGKSEATIRVWGGALWVTKFRIEGVDVLKLLSPGSPPHLPQERALWSTGRENEFRIAFGSPPDAGQGKTGCRPFWVTLDSMHSRGTPTDLLLFSDTEEGGHILTYLSTNTTMRRA